MIEDRILLAIQDLNKLRAELKEIKKSLREEEKIENEDYAEMKKTSKDLKQQLKDFEDVFKRDLSNDSDYKRLLELKVTKEEEIADSSEKLFEAIAKLPPKAFEMNVDTEEGNVRVQVQPEMRVYLNGREEKRV